jgi:CRP-like cAMP-binding protein
MDLILNILKKIPLLQGLTEQQHMSIVDHIKMEYFPVAYTIFEKGAQGNALYLIKSGQVKIVDEGKELAVLGEGDFFGEIALLESAARMANAITLSDCEIFVLQSEDFQLLLEKEPEIALKVNEAYTSRKSENSL